MKCGSIRTKGLVLVNHPYIMMLFVIEDNHFLSDVSLHHDHVGYGPKARPGRYASAGLTL